MCPVEIRLAFLKFTNIKPLSNLINVAYWFKCCTHIYIRCYSIKISKLYGLHTPPILCINPYNAVLLVFLAMCNILIR